MPSPYPRSTASSHANQWICNCGPDLVAEQQRPRRGACVVADARHSDRDQDAVAGERRRLTRPGVTAMKISTPTTRLRSTAPCFSASPPSSITFFSARTAPRSLVNRCISVLCWRSGFRSSGIWRMHGLELGNSSGFLQKTIGRVWIFFRRINLIWMRLISTSCGPPIEICGENFPSIHLLIRF